MRRNFIFHLHPARVTAHALNPTATFGLGLITATLFAALGFSGVLLMIYYVPTTREALSSTQDIQHAVTFGAFFRALHRWAAHAMVFTVFLHFLRVCLTGSYFRRELNWMIGLALFFTTLGLAFTGYLLPWDQLSFWAVRVGTNLADHIPLIGGFLKKLLLGGDQVGQAALIRFYTLHVALLPSLMLGLIIFHIWRVRKDGGLARETKDETDPVTIPAWPHLLLREAILIMCVLTVLVLAASFISAPLGGAPDIHSPSNPEKTPWYFLWLQEMVSYSAPLGGFVFPGILVAGLLLLPFLEREQNGVGSWFGGPRGRLIVAFSFVIAIAFFILFEWLFHITAIQSWIAGGPTWLGDFFNPATGMLLLAVAVSITSKIISKSTRNAVLACTMVVLVAIVCFTLMAWCRGPGWVFYWPWEEWPNAS
ncbi:MAG: cytochrome bc complex cytochrome b subunit [Deltaproteobacteria bacterium]|nr:cytochrome bc complex cytochrome b subunit [Deltaproteobacteria bacterium]